MTDRDALYEKKENLNEQCSTANSLVGRSLRGGLTIGVFVTLAACALVGSNVSRLIDESRDFVCSSSLLTTKEVENYKKLSSLEEVPDIIAEEGTKGEKDDPELEFEEEQYDGSASEMSTLKEFDFDAEEPEKTADAAPVFSQETEKKDDAVVLPESLAEPQKENGKEMQFGSIPLDFDQNLSKSNAYGPARYFARAANIVDSRLNVARYFARAANIWGGRDSFSPNLFSSAAKRAIDADVAERLHENELAQCNRDVKNLCSQSVATANFDSPDNNWGGIALAGYQKKTEKIEVGEQVNDRKDTSLATKLDVPNDSRLKSLTPEEEKIVEKARQDLLAFGVMGAYIENWGEKGFRATGMARSEDGKAVFYEGFGNDPQDAANMLMNAVQKGVKRTSGE